MSDTQEQISSPQQQLCTSSETDLFSMPYLNTDIERTWFKVYDPHSAVPQGGPIEFELYPIPENYIDLNQILLKIEWHITDQHGNTINPTRQIKREPTRDAETVDNPQYYVAPINYFGATAFKQVEVKLNDVETEDTHQLYAYKAYLQTLLTYNSNVKENELKIALYSKTDDADPEDNNKAKMEGTSNPGLKYRHEEVKGSRHFHTSCRIHADIFNQPRLLADKIKMNIRLHLHDHPFSLMAADNSLHYKIVVDRARLWVLYKKIRPHIIHDHVRRLLQNGKNVKGNKMLYPVTRTELKFSTHNEGSSYITRPQLSSGAALPQKIIIGLVNTNAFNGALTLSPFNFKNYSISEIQLWKNDVKIPYETLQFNRANNDKMEGYLSLLHGTGRLFSNDDLGMSLEKYLNGSNLYFFNLTASNSFCDQQDPIDEGNISLHIRFSTALPENVTLIAYLEYIGLVEVSQQDPVTERRTVVYHTRAGHEEGKMLK